MDYFTTRKDDLVGWVRKFSLFPYPFVTACCGMEFMSVSSTLYDTDRFGAALPRFTPRQSDLLMVVGTVSHKQAQTIKRVYEQMCEPRWVIAWGACAISGGAYTNYATISGLSRILPVDVVVPGCPPAPQALRDALERLRSGEARRRRGSSSAVGEQPIGGSIGVPGTVQAFVRSDSGRAKDGFESP